MAAWDIQYDADSQTLTIEFPNGDEYTWDGVPPDIVAKVAESDNRAAAYNRYIRNKY